MPITDISKGLSEAELRRLSPSASVRKFGSEIVTAAGALPILDVACGGGRNSALLAHLGGRVIAIDIDLRRIEAERIALEKTTLGRALRKVELHQFDLLQNEWPYEPSSIGGIVNIHFLQDSLLAPFSASLVTGGFLILESVEARGGNYRLLPGARALRTALESSFSLLVYKEDGGIVEGIDAVTVKLVARKN
jgi:SAM-dependent methyltransferase